MFLKHGGNRTTTIGALENVRMVIETAMVEGLVGSGQVLRELSQKRAFLVALKPRDRMRLLALVRSSPTAFLQTSSSWMLALVILERRGGVM